MAPLPPFMEPMPILVRRLYAPLVDFVVFALALVSPYFCNQIATTNQGTLWAFRLVDKVG